MNLGKGIFVLSFILFAESALAQIDPDPDGIGIYFDQGATINSVTVAEGTPYVTAYLVLTNPSVLGNMVHWSCSISSFLEGPGLAQVSGSHTGGFNLDTNMPGSEHWSFEISFDPETENPTTGITVLAQLHIVPHVHDEPIYLYVRNGAGGFAFYGTDNGGADFNPSSGSWGLPVAVINGEASVAVEPESWGGVKSLYR
jgi:hypothetical protein